MKAIQRELERARAVGIDARLIRNPNKVARKHSAAGSTYSPSRTLWLDGQGYSLAGARQYIDARKGETMVKRYKTSEAFAAEKPILTEEEAARLLQEYGLTFAEFKNDALWCHAARVGYVYFNKIRTQFVLDYLYQVALKR